ncbi:RHS repeat-associated core domain-containing protein, partial [Pseudomonas sp. F1_0610]|uniref:RHS repeat-associated core domain-containing protein n=1 Tax=Pseudomonas sp. F1_0610 TaxID=3114284 RepID=UPI0039C35D56
AANSEGTTTWQAQMQAFGETTPDSTNLITMNLRYPGQYFDAETGTHYNYYRDYNPRVGRYSQSDPIGLGGGINHYGYAGGNALRYRDPEGRVVWFAPLLMMAARATASFIIDIIIISYAVDSKLSSSPILITEGIQTECGNVQCADDISANNTAYVPALEELKIPSAQGYPDSSQDDIVIKPYQGYEPYVKTAEDFIYYKEEEEESTSGGAEHTSNARPSSRGKHERGRARNKRDQRGGEKGDIRRKYRR